VSAVSAALLSAASGPAAQAAGSAWRLALRRTPTRLKAYLYGTWVLSGLLFLIGEATLAGARSAVKTIGRDTAPSIIAAQEISSALADLDASEASYLIGTRRHQATAQKTFEETRVKVTSRLVEAASNITFGEAERVPINVMFDGLGRYLELAAEARYRHDTGDQTGATGSYSVATDLMHQRILPAADSLDHANRQHLDLEYRRQRTTSSGSEVLAGIVGVALLVALLSAQVFLLRRMRRILNPPLLAATGIGAVFLLYLITSMSAAASELRRAKVDAFASIHTLFQARSIAYDAKGDESRTLLDPSRASYYEQTFQSKVQRLTSLPEPTDAMLSSVAPGNKASFSGLFADALNNITFGGERQAATQMLREFAQFHAIDARIRAFERGSKHAAAVELCLGGGTDQANAAYIRFDRALMDMIQINRKEFDDTVTRAEDGLKRAAFFVPAAALAIALLAFIGLRARIREYAA
jgi:hypothetical protein